jgi:hypothetical protein
LSLHTPKGMFSTGKSLSGFTSIQVFISFFLLCFCKCPRAPRSPEGDGQPAHLLFSLFVNRQSLSSIVYQSLCAPRSPKGDDQPAHLLFYTIRKSSIVLVNPRLQRGKLYIKVSLFSPVLFQLRQKAP